MTAHHNVIADNVDGVIKSLEEAWKILFKWFNEWKLMLTNNTVKIKMGKFDLTNSKSEKLLGVKLTITYTIFR